MGDALTWGRHYLAVSPEHFRVEYAINPFMDTADQPDPELAREQWDALIGAMESRGARVEVLAPRADSPDMVFAMNLGLPLRTAGSEPGSEPGSESDSEARAVLSHMRYPERRGETDTAEAWFADAGYRPLVVGRHAIGPHFEAGDAFAWRGDLVVGYGMRTERLALKHLALELDVRVHGLRIAHPGMYHLDLAFCPLDSERAMICPEALTPASARKALELVPEPLVLTEAEALTFCANSIVIDQTVLMPACPPRVRRRLEDWGFEVVVADVAEFLKGGGAIRCMTNPLDVTIGAEAAEGADQGTADLVRRGAEVLLR